MHYKSPVLKFDVHDYAGITHRQKFVLNIFVNTGKQADKTVRYSVIEKVLLIKILLLKKNTK